MVCQRQALITGSYPGSAREGTNLQKHSRDHNTTLFRLRSETILFSISLIFMMTDSGFTFLTVDGQGRPLEPGSRSTIRSRCMMGVNVRQDSRRSKRRTRKTAGSTKPSTQGSPRESGIAERFQKTGTTVASRVQGTTTCSPPLRSLQLRSMHFSLDLPHMSSSALFTGQLPTRSSHELNH